MQLASDILIDRSPEQVWAFLGDPENTAKWDRGVARVEASPGPRTIGFQFDTIAHDHLNLPDNGRMSYRIREVDPIGRLCVVELTSNTGNARFFKSAEWRFQVCSEGAGSRLTCKVLFHLRPLYIFLAPLLYWKRDAIMLDLTLLKHSIETQPA